MVTTNSPLTSIISLDQIDIPSDARAHDPAALEVLAHDMSVQGQLQEIVVLPRVGVSAGRSVGESENENTPNRRTADPLYEVIAGVGRTLAARKLGWKEIRASVREGVSDFDRARITFAENEDREDVDPFYQAGLIQKMLKANSLTQEALAKELGMSTATVSIYVAIDGLPEEIPAKFKRLNFGQLMQIARLNSDDSKIEYAENCAKNDLSVRQLKAQVDRALKKPSRRSLSLSQSPIPDPLANEWDSIHSKLMEAGDAYWEVKYGEHQLPTKDKIEGWFFFVKPQVPEGELKSGLARWFGAMKQALEGGKVENSYAKIRQEMDETRRKLENDVFGGPIRLPKTAAERQELENIAAAGSPQDVYAWIYGKDSPMFKMAPPSWKDFNMTPADGLKQLLEGIRQLKKIGVNTSGQSAEW